MWSPFASLLHPSKKGFSFHFSLGKKRIYLETHLKGEFTDLFWKFIYFEDKSCYIWFQHAFNDKVFIARCLLKYWLIFSSFLIFCYFTRLKARETSDKIWETRKIFPILHSTPCDNNYIFSTTFKRHWKQKI